ncbi:hypothetical protein [Oceanicoccus sagamiensis]|uniref:Nucleoside transporter/FeoB GTPase Gate domain-containing protein n=1 Tax=Oceanicoccus sagamiensis TaxID=716816 RepID=A0A1X9NDS0_9GAMM|nr:hypothetical protein [Oceanicoccus sagamiensis]ARN76180.1 hypothetical protein BST96_19990 [Oceanicoccus sagamiensis]
MTSIKRQPFKASLIDWLAEVWLIFWSLVKIMVPVLLVVRLVEIAGWIDDLGLLIQPLMVLVGLPGEMGLVWMATMVGNIYTGMAVFYQLGLGEQVTVAQVSVIGSMMLIAHSLPVEVAIARATGVSLWFTLLLRIGGALLLGLVLNGIYNYFSLLQTPAPLLWQPEIADSSWAGWLLTQGQTLLAALLIIAGLTLLIRILRLLGIERLIHLVLEPFLRALGIGVKASNIMLVGLTLGLSFGGGLLIREARSGSIGGKDIFMTMAFLGLCHSLIEDTLLILLLGADLTTILWGRLAFSLLVIILFAHLFKQIPDKRLKWFYRSPSGAPANKAD